MSLLLKQHKEKENEISKLVYNNILLITHFYPTSKEFDKLFKKEMFDKNNKAAVYEVIYYLLNVLDPSLTKQYITTWPLLSIKEENKFRSELIKYINQLNSLYDIANIPTLMASQLISPSGYKFLKFMLKLSELVIILHLKKHGKDDLLNPIKPNKNICITDTTVRKIKNKISSLEAETVALAQEHQNFFQQSKNGAAAIVNELDQVNFEIREGKERYSVMKEEFLRKYSAYPSLDVLQKQWEELQKNSKQLNEVHKLFLETKQLITFLLGNNLVMEYNKSELQVPNEIYYLFNNEKELDLIQFFHGLHVLLERKILELAHPTSTFLVTNLEKVNELKENLYAVQVSFTQKQDELLRFMDKQKDFFLNENLSQC